MNFVWTPDRIQTKEHEMPIWLVTCLLLCLEIVKVLGLVIKNVCVCVCVCVRVRVCVCVCVCVSVNV